MPHEEIAVAPPAAAIATAEEAIAAVRAALGPACRAVMVVSGVVDGEVSGVVIPDDNPKNDYIAGQELADGVVYLVIGLGKLPTVAPPGVTIL